MHALVHYSRMLAAFVVASLLFANDLPRRAALGVIFRESGIVQDVVAGSAAERAGIQRDDVILAIDSPPITLGKHVTVKLKRGDTEIAKELVATEFPRESSPDYDTIYGSVTIPAGRLRTVAT